MKSLNVSIVIILIGLFSFGLSAQNNNEITLIQELSLNNIEEVILRQNIDFERQYWAKETIYLEINVKTNTGKSRVVQQLIANGRYTISSVKESNLLFISMDKLRQQVTINGKPYQDQIYIRLWVPDYLKISSEYEQPALAIE